MAIVCVPSTLPDTPHSLPSRVVKGQRADFLVPLRRNVPVGEEDVVLRFEIDPAIDLTFKDGSKTRTATHRVTPTCAFTVTPYEMKGSFTGGTFVDLFVDNTRESVIRVDVD